MRWAQIGKFAVLVLSWACALAISAVIELYWPGVYEFVVEGAIGVALAWWIFGVPR